jgi:hypothetical protein
VPPPALWLTAAACLACVLNLVFSRELWTNAAAAERWTWPVLGLLLLAGLWQVMHLLWRWLRAYSGPRWMETLLRLALILATAGSVLLGIALSAAIIISTA